MRQVVTINIRGVPMVGTYHEPHGTVGPVETRVGALFLNFGHMPRAGRGDVAVRIAEELAVGGWDVFRFDLPGLGDSPGWLPEHVLPMWQFVERGGFAPWTAALATELVKKFKLKGMVLGGLCGGAVTSLMGADLRPEGVLGLVLLEPEVVLLEPPVKGGKAGGPGVPGGPAGVGGPGGGGAAGSAGGAKGADSKKEDLGHGLPGMLRQVIRNPWLKSVRKAYHTMKKSGRVMMGEMPTDDINMPVALACKRLAGLGMPMMVALTKPGKQPFWRRYIFRLRKGHRVNFVEITGTNHIMLSGGGKETAATEVRKWFEATFPARAGTETRNAKHET